MSGSDLGTLDLVCRAMDSPLRPLDYALLLHFKQPLDGAGLRKGALSARNLYPSTGSTIEGRKWRRLEAPEHGLRVAKAEGGGTAGAIREFLRVPFRLDREPPLRQLLIESMNGPACLVTRVHHAAGDLLSTLMWIGHQLRVGSGRDLFVGKHGPFRAPQVAPIRSPRVEERFGVPGTMPPDLDAQCGALPRTRLDDIRDPGIGAFGTVTRQGRVYIQRCPDRLCPRYAALVEQPARRDRKENRRVVADEHSRRPVQGIR